MNTKTLLLLITAGLAACGTADSDSSTDALEPGGQSTNGTANQTTTNTRTNGSTTTPTNGATSGGTGANNADDPNVTPSSGFTDLYEQLIAEGGCSAGYCHGSAVATADLMYDFLVNSPGKAATTCDATMLVAPGDPASSLLWYRIRPAEMDDGAPCATKMPAGSDSGLSQETATLVYDWILDGAPR